MFMAWLETKRESLRMSATEFARLIGVPLDAYVRQRKNQRPTARTIAAAFRRWPEDTEDMAVALRAGLNGHHDDSGDEAAS